MAGLTDSYGSSSGSELLAELDRKVEAAVTDRLSSIDRRARYSEEDIKKREAGGFWEEFVAEPVQDVLEEFTEVFGGDPTSVADGLANFESLVHSLFDPESILASLTAGTLPSDILSLDRILPVLGIPKGLIERVPGIAGVKDPEAGHECDRNLIASTVGTIGRVAAGAVGNAVKAVRAVQLTSALLIDQVEDFGVGLMDRPVQTLLATMGSQDVILGQVASVVKRINEIVADLDDDDYFFDHVRLIRDAQFRLINADLDLATLENLLLNGQRFDQALFDRARDDIDETAKDLCGVGLKEIFAGLSEKPFILTGLLLHLEVLLRVLGRQQEVRDELAIRVQNFQLDFFDATRFDNLYGPVVDMIRCRLRKIIEDMDATVAKNQFVRYLLKEKQWCLELIALKAFMKLSNKLSLPENVNKFTGTQALQDAADTVVDALGSADYELYKASVGDVVLDGQIYITEVRRKITQNFVPDRIIALGDSIIARVEQGRGRGSFLGGVLNGFSGEVASTIGTVVAVISQVMEFAEERGVQDFADAISEGRITEAFGLDGLTASIEGQITTLVTQLVAQSRSVGGNPIAEAELLIVNEVFRDEALSVGLVDELLNDSSSQHIEELFEVEAVEFRGTQAALQRAADDLEEEIPNREAKIIDPVEARKQKLAEIGSGGPELTDVNGLLDLDSVV